MPWTEVDGRKKYVPSIYAKEELPTWNEIYNEFLKNGVFDYDPKNPDHQTLDPYWKIPRRKILLAVVCNQFNKMMYEDNDNSILAQRVGTTINPERLQIRFVNAAAFILSNSHHINIPNDLTSFTVPPIYTIPLPTRDKNPFILPTNRNVQRLNVSKMDCYLQIQLLVQTKGLHDPNNKSMFTISPDDEDFYKVINAVTKEIRGYFEGSAVGWKDKEGKLIESDPMKPICHSRSDPAL